jgi:uncharacterized OB-fold protein
MGREKGNRVRTHQQKKIGARVKTKGRKREERGGQDEGSK